MDKYQLMLAQLVYLKNIPEIRKIIEDPSDPVALKEKIVELGRNPYNSLHEASILGDLEILKLLLSKMTSNEALEAVSVETRDRETCLILACASTSAYNVYDVIDYLLKLGSDPNARDRMGYTPLFYACKKGDFRMVQLLNAKGADLMAAANDGLVPLDVAISRRDRELVNYFLQHYQKETEKQMKFYTYAFALNNMPDIVPTVLSLMGSADIRKFLCDPHSTKVCRQFNNIIKVAQAEMSDRQRAEPSSELNRFILKHYQRRTNLRYINADQALMLLIDMIAFDNESDEDFPLSVDATTCQPIEEFALQLCSAMNTAQILLVEDSTSDKTIGDVDEDLASDETICDGALLKFFPELDRRQRISLKSKARHVLRCHLNKKLGNLEAYNWLNANLTAPGLKNYLFYEEVPYLIREEDRI